MLLTRSICRCHVSHSISFLRQMSTSRSTGFKPTIKSVAEIRKRTTATIEKAREALVASKGDVEKALEWLDEDRVASGLKKAEKVASRFTGEGLVGVAVLTKGTTASNLADGQIRAAMLELNCETDFVARNELFRQLTQDLAFTAAYLGEMEIVEGSAWALKKSLMLPMDMSYIQNAPLMQRDPSRTKEISVSEAIRDVINAVGENITIRRAATLVHTAPLKIDDGCGMRVASYVHNAIRKTESSPGSPSPSSSSSSSQVSCVYEAQGKIGALLAIMLKTDVNENLRQLFEKDKSFEKELEEYERGLARQVVGMSPSSVFDGPDSLYSQSFDMMPSAEGKTVIEALQHWSLQHDLITRLQNPIYGLNVAQFSRWEVGEKLVEEVEEEEEEEEVD